MLADGPQFEGGLAEAVAAQVVALAGSYSHVVGAATAYGKNILPRVAAKLDVAQVSDIISVESPDTFTRPIYAGNAIATVQSTDQVKVITARPTNFDPAAAEGGSATVEKRGSRWPARTRRASSRATSRSPTVPNCRARRSSFPADAAWARRTTSSCSNRWPTS